MSAIGFYFRKCHGDPDKLRARLNAIAAGLGYTATRGPTAGQGNLPELLAAIDAGEVALVLLPTEHQAWTAEWLEEQAQALLEERAQAMLGDPENFHTLGLAEALETIAMSLREAHSRQSATPDRSEPVHSDTSPPKPHPRV